MTLTSRLEGDRIEGELLVQGPANPSAMVHIILAERAVLYPGRSKVVVHHMVARAALTDSIKGMPYVPADGGMRVPFTGALDEIWRDNQTYLTQLQAEGMGAVQKFAARMDAKQLTIVAFLRDDTTRATLQAVQANPKLPEDDA